MEKVFLRVYNREIEGMIEGGQLDEAVAHCQHILKTFPMHVETYRLLGKSFLEARRYADAADIFQRILNAVPDDFVAHVGMSIIRDDGGQLDDAIWHMERAFEIQPANSAIQGELRRLYGRRDGTEPSKIRLSRDALANMYSQGELFNQAIAEIRSILADDPNRPDLQVMLMRAYHRTGQKVEAAEIAATLLKKYPYCLDSLRVLVDVLPGTARAENTQVYRHRLLMLDPYSTSASDSVFSTDQVADSAVILERLDYKPGAMPSSPQPDWASSLGIKLTTEKRSEPPPEKIQTPKVAEEPTACPPERLDVGIASAANVAEEPTANLPEHLDAGIASAVHAAEETVPDWRHPAGWMDSTGEPKDDSGKTGEVTPDGLIAKSDAGKTGEVSPDESIAKADIPEWLISMAPTGNIEAESTEPEEPAVALPTGEDGIPEWLKPIAPREGSTELKIESQSSGGPTSEGEVNPTAPVEAAGELLVESEGSIGTQPAKDEEIPVWIKASTPVEIAGAAIQEPRESAEPQPTSGEDLPQWLKAMTAAEAIGETLKVPQEPVESRPEMAEDIPDWIKSMAPKEAIGETLKESQEVIESQPAVSEDIPDWLKSVAPADTTAKLNVESEPTPSAGPAEEPEAEPTSVEKTSTGEEALPDWLTDLGSKVTPEAPAAATEEQPAIREQPVPEQAVQEKPGIQTAAETPVTEPETMGESFRPSGEIKPLNIGDDALGWLESLAAKQGAKPEELLTNPQDRPVEMPEWLRQPGEKPTEASAVPTEEVIGPVETLPLEPQDRLAGPSTTVTGLPEDEAMPMREEGKPSELPTEEAAKPEVQPAGGEAEMISWLERLSEDQESSLKEALPSPEKIPEATADKNQQISDTQPTVKLTKESTPVPSEPAAGEDITITSWLSKQDVEEALGKAATERLNEERPTSPAVELPDWLKDLEGPPIPVVSPKAVEDLPDWLRTPIAPMEPEKASESEVPAWVDENIPSTGQAVPTMPEEWIPAETKPVAGIEPGTSAEPTPVEENLPAAEPVSMNETIPASETKPAAVPEPVSEPAAFSVHSLLHPPTLKQTGMLSAVPEEDKDAELLSDAQTILDQDSLDESMKQYTKLIKKGRLLDEVIHDLREAIYRYPVDVIIWQTLGDAYMRANRLQDALDAYTKAEELLR